MSSARVPPTLSGVRAERACMELFELPRGAVRRLFEAKRVRKGGRALRKGDAVGAGDEIELAGGGAWFVATADRLPELFVNAEVAVVDKPAGMPSHPLVPGEGGTAVDVLVSMYPEMADVPELVGAAREAGLVHRLDTGTSGCLAFARQSARWAELRAAFTEGRVRKTYLALVEGEVKKELNLEAPLAHDPHDSRRMRVDPSGKSARSHVRVLSSGRDPDTAAMFSLVEVEAEGGRRHQVRAHLALAGHVLVGDVLYGAALSPDAPWHQLHAHGLGLPGLPWVQAPPPAAFMKAAAARGLVVPDKAMVRLP